MATNEKLRTEDIIEILDSKILTTRGHPGLGVTPREPYDSVLTKISELVLTPSQKEALDATLSTPSSSNPVVLKDDLETYIPAANLGSVKDSVNDFSMLPLTGNVDGDLRPALFEKIIYRWKDSTSEWLPFISTGTLDHTELVNQNNDSDFQHLTTAEKTLLLSQSHTHSNQSILNNIISAGSGDIISADERSRLPTANEKLALIGTSGSPSATNKFVTALDPRLSTVRNPYVTVGLPGSLATFTGVDFVPFEDALVAIHNGTATTVKAIQVLPGVYPIGGVVLLWSIQSSSLLIESLVPHAATLSFQTFAAGIQALLPGTGSLTIRGFVFEVNDLGTSGIRSQRQNTLIENCIFKPGPTTSINQVGVILEGDNSVIRRCRFEKELEKGIEIRASNCRVEECVFDLSDPAKSGVHVITGSNSLIDHCTFNNGVVKVEPAASFTQIYNNYFKVDNTKATVSVSGVAMTGLNKLTNGDIAVFQTTGTDPVGLESGKNYYVRNRLITGFNVSETPLGSLVTTTSGGTGTHSFRKVNFIYDSGFSSRALQNLPQEVNQPYLGRIKTIGPSGSFADYQGDDETPFYRAFQDPLVNEIQVLAGTYTFKKRLIVPQRVKIVGITQGSSAVTLTGNSIFNMPSFSTLENLTITSNGTAITTSSPSNLRIERCTFNLQVASTGLSLVNGADCFIYDNTFTGGGIAITTTNGTRVKLVRNIFGTSVLNMTGTNTTCHIMDNNFTALPVIATVLSIISGNIFALVPTKTNTSTTMWGGNWPLEANNFDGIDTVTVPVLDCLDPITVGCVLDTIEDGATSFGSVSFVEHLDCGAISRPVKLNSKVNTSNNYSVHLNWVSDTGIGDVRWEVQVTWSTETNLGATTTSSNTVTRTTTTKTMNTVTPFVLTGFGGIVDPKYVAIKVRRLGAAVTDTLVGKAHLTKVTLTYSRD